MHTIPSPQKKPGEKKPYGILRYRCEDNFKMGL
jgi:hypothetical protein